jgi:hypothetical protein
MGGIGSGRRGGLKKRRVEAHIALKVGELQHAGGLAPGASGTLSWGAAAVTMAFRASAADLTLRYRVDDGANSQDILERVPLVRVAAGFGGMRCYFRCPGLGCGRRALVLYLTRGLFRCRRCHGLAYESQCEDAERLIVRHADKARARLGYPIWRPFSLAPIARPKGMWRCKFLRLQYSVDEADEIATTAHVRGLRALADKVCGSEKHSRRES